MLNLVFCGEETSNRPGEIQHHPAFKGELLYSEGFGRLQHGGAESHIRIFGKVLPNWWKKNPERHENQLGIIIPNRGLEK